MLFTGKEPFKVFEDTASLLLRDQVMIIKQLIKYTARYSKAKAKDETLPPAPVLILT